MVLAAAWGDGHTGQIAARPQGLGGAVGRVRVDLGDRLARFRIRPPSYEAEAAPPLQASAASRTRPLKYPVPSGPKPTQPSEARWKGRPHGVRWVSGNAVPVKRVAVRALAPPLDQRPCRKMPIALR
ncbi:hypothetical protein [Streptomyces acidiscabies]|uniref:Uncharacterized protein n=1 Tax=Streptomyces acidiscabies TaxID=42234 RepID=A0AAP6ELB7_9ACTN|nr:hypothetical protein [Streptomyces acidiscabies]MBP5942209.1 hypothetical protein [Streptomyces sp. LBUM 1476]MBZ3913729.1 hypothetical protein [Streptomyces acidiscabies]MDX2966934.1 hypothetical protein [Streptomyces acidiscabies]MDX3022180.1 hypothetical protein [Streptomyces acidiscabies]MDX3795443.1 hypothetical protein [Streptomyces acidiscabies]